VKPQKTRVCIVRVVCNGLESTLDDDAERTLATKDTRQEETKADRFEVRLTCALEAVFVGAFQQTEVLRVVDVAEFEVRADGVNDILARQIAGDRDLGVARVATLVSGE